MSLRDFPGMHPHLNEWIANQGYVRRSHPWGFLNTIEHITKENDMRIYTDENGVAVNAITGVEGKDTTGKIYQILAGLGSVNLQFQKGPITELGPNGITTEALLEVCKHRLTHIDKLVPCIENKVALDCVTRALEALEERNKDRKERNVTGTAVV